jgi:hypothetical protein
MIVAVVLLWTLQIADVRPCSIIPDSCATGKLWQPTLREQLEHQQNEVLTERAEQQRAQRQRFLKRWLEL